MDFALSPAAEATCARMWDSCAARVPRRAGVGGDLREHGEHEHPPVMEELKAEARRRACGTSFHREQSGLSNVEYAAVAEITGWSPVIAPEAINCQAPDTGNMETCKLFAYRRSRRERWLEPLLAGEIRSASR